VFRCNERFHSGRQELLRLMEEGNLVVSEHYRLPKHYIGELSIEALCSFRSVGCALLLL